MYHEHAEWETHKPLTRLSAVSMVCNCVQKSLLCGCCRKDGDVYRSLLEVAQRSPFNDTEEGPAWKPVLESRLNPKLRASSKL